MHGLPHDLRVALDRLDLRSKRMKPEPLACHFPPVVSGRADGDGMATLAQAARHGDVRMQVAKRAEGCEEEARQPPD